MPPIYPQFRIIALLVAVPVAVALFWPLSVIDAIALALGFGFALAVELTGIHVVRRDQRAAAERQRQQIQQAIDLVEDLPTGEKPDAARERVV